MATKKRIFVEVELLRTLAVVLDDMLATLLPGPVTVSDLTTADIQRLRERCYRALRDGAEGSMTATATRSPGRP
jgi:hypothetical protein